MLFIANEQTFERQRWQQFLVYIGFTLAAFLTNAFLNKALPVVYRGACLYFPPVPERLLKIASHLVDWRFCLRFNCGFGVRFSGL